MFNSENIITLATLTVIFLETIVLIWYLNKQNAPIRTTVVQSLGVMLFVPLIFLLSFLGKVEENTVSTLLGAFIGYLFSKKSLPEEWGGQGFAPAK